MPCQFDRTWNSPSDDSDTAEENEQNTANPNVSIIIVKGIYYPKNHLKIPSAFVVCCKFLLTLFNKVKYRDKQCGPRSACSYRSSLV